MAFCIWEVCVYHCSSCFMTLTVLFYNRTARAQIGSPYVILDGPDMYLQFILHCILFDLLQWWLRCLKKISAKMTLLFIERWNFKINVYHNYNIKQSLNKVVYSLKYTHYCVLSFVYNISSLIRLLRLNVLSIEIHSVVFTLQKQKYPFSIFYEVYWTNASMCHNYCI